MPRHGELPDTSALQDPSPFPSKRLSRHNLIAVEFAVDGKSPRL